MSNVQIKNITNIDIELDNGNILFFKDEISNETINKIKNSELSILEFYSLIDSTQSFTTLDCLTNIIARTEDLLAILCSLQEKYTTLNNKNINKICDKISDLIEETRTKLEADGMDVKDSRILLAQGKHPCYGIEEQFRK